ncbi:hypothetical protein TCAL_05837 [Tigriopus californicus]|uniref:ATP synthase subunit b n=1 Tax=Tigriopus californicus TaxID=6832 RepID=A0A553P5T3_TIGCA|nr:ATP synthase subunit b, mitochondrial-like [Tigriopus californicus]TRY73047.1 hypothetical protein TCAL_05837 [Tigriopus californicus]
MLSRLAITAGSRNSGSFIWGRSSAALSTAQPLSNNAPVIIQESPERDLVNFPRRQRPIDAPPVRLGFLPEEWFTAFHAKTGATGPYMFMASVGTYMISKEIYVLEHEFYSGIAFAGLLMYMYKRLSPDVGTYVDGLVQAKEDQLRSIRQNEIDRCQASITEEEKAQWMATSYESLIQAKKDNVALQLEAAYRERLAEAYSQVKRRLDFQMERVNVLRRVEQKHMTNWIINSVKTSITSKQEDEALKQCVADLKALAAK